MLAYRTKPASPWYNGVVRERPDQEWNFSGDRVRLRPTNDFIFKKLFGEEQSKPALLSLLNAILRLSNENRLTDVLIIENKELTKEQLEDKTGRLDIRAETMDGVQIDIEMQLVNEMNMDRRTLFYFGKLFLQSIKAGDSYHALKKTITINFVDFKFLPVRKFHSSFHLYEDQEKEIMLTDMMEIHFIELPKFRAARYDLHDPLHRWLLFLEQNIPENLLEELMAMDPTIRGAEEQLEMLSSDEKARIMYEFRENSRIERNSLIKSGWIQGEQAGIEKGIEKGIDEGRKEIIRKFFDAGMDIEKIAEITEIPLDKVRKLLEG